MPAEWLRLWDGCGPLAAAKGSLLSNRIDSAVRCGDRMMSRPIRDIFSTTGGYLVFDHGDFEFNDRCQMSATGWQRGVPGREIKRLLF
jgi:hypothetical protein